MPELKHCRAADLGMDEARAIAALIDATWPSPDLSPDDLVDRLLHQGPSDRDAFTLWEDGALLAHAITFPRRILHDDGDLEVMGLAGVCVPPRHRGKGYGKRVVAEAFRQVTEGKYPVSLFQTGVPSFYARFGAVPVSNPFRNSRSDEDPSTSPWWEPHVMIYPDFVGWPPGVIDLNGPGY